MYRWGVPNPLNYWGPKSSARSMPSATEQDASYLRKVSYVAALAHTPIVKGDLVILILR
jgi:hypothetical protein